MEDDDINDDEELFEGMRFQQPYDEQVNDYGKAVSNHIQSGFVDLTVEDELDWMEIVLPEDQIETDPIVAEIASGDTAVDYSWQYWLHDENTYPPVNEEGAPTVPSGWVDWVTMTEVP